jgi:hypothetical protein
MSRLSFDKWKNSSQAAVRALKLSQGQAIFAKGGGHFLRWFRIFWVHDIPKLLRKVGEIMVSFLRKCREIISLVGVNLLFQWRSFVEYLKVVTRFYNHPRFLRVDLTFLFLYLFRNPFKMSKRFLQFRRKQQVHAYGETPLTTMAMIAERCKITPKDTVFELGAGRGRAAFWLAEYLGCRVVAVEQIGKFVQKACFLKSYFSIPQLEFRHQDIVETDFTGATVLYLYGTCLEEETIRKFIQKCALLPSGAKIITVSFSLSEYTKEPLFEVMHRFPATFQWGTGDVYLQVRK